MKPFLYLLSGVLVTPGLLLSLFIWLVSTTVADGERYQNLFRTLYHLAIRLLKLMDWGIVLIPIFATLWLVLAFIPQYRVYGAACTALVAVASLVGMFAIGSGQLKTDALFFPALSFAGLLISLWLVWKGLAPVLTTRS